ncbi:LysR family transcriptional regulator [Halomonas elongata]|uniref:LysR family transcription regulator AmpR n=1 Tax=Halomonas elongata (strain ATCC 33173 / DSM 2581 / NBRC 15536 / NCIMB 2198 / 1H9) TaxID=768066 RepID=E1V6J7_HALED|nr:LysR family transcriptional regulator [Halomonas elongata]MDL4861163.1 LysR family transcriptional regulator [Halomonas elongata]WBF18559.1 LysR family transcriptional regulator [Halomonas elongata]WPU47413.1 LysR family transcriptional regulator [Halomonas elongata DSM 2581]WVI72083.1 LysR family transcriptional regulator [Halomonas elongata]CBV41326.1 LysR family transcription regulator AmpR [Halomonas elongata DSM 2581]
MARPHLPLNALRAFEAAARHASFTQAANELNVTQAAVSHQVKLLESRLDVALFKRLPRGLLITPEGEALLPVMQDSFDRMAEMLERLETGRVRDILMVGAVGTFAVGWLLPHLPDFQARHPLIEIRLSTHNNRADIAAEGLDYAVRFGDGGWHGTEAMPLFEAPLSPLCIPRIAESLHEPSDLMHHTLLRSYREHEWTSWFEAAGVHATPPLAQGIVFDSSLAMMDAALQGAGVALCPPRMFTRQLASGAIRQPFDLHTSMGGYWLTRLKSRPVTPAMHAFETWLGEASTPHRAMDTGHFPEHRPLP